MTDQRPVDLAEHLPAPATGGSPEPWWRRAWRPLRDWGTTLLIGVALMHMVGKLRAPELPQQAPDFALQTLDGETVRLSSLRGQTVVLNFWATWCGPCRLEIPSFTQFAADHPQIPVYGIATEGSVESLRAAQRQLDIGYPVLRADAATLAAYHIDTLPTTVVVGPDGEVKSAHAGILTGPQLRLAVQ